jgi:protein SCO1/2
MTDNMKILQDKFIDDSEILLLSHSVIPEKDNVAVLKEYAKDKGCFGQMAIYLQVTKKDLFNS